jgi:hypothetical protein
MKSFRQFLSEGNLAPAELYKYDWRLELFLDKYKNGKPFDLVNGKQIVIIYDQSVEADLRNKNNPGKIIFTGLDQNKYKLSDFAKSKEFGGGGGSGAGAGITKLAECAQAVYCQARWNNTKDYNPTDLEKAWKHADVDDTVQRIIHDLPKEWVASSIIGAEKLYTTFGSKQYTFHRGSAWVNKLETIFKKLNKADGSFSNINKWSPADIYMVSAKGMTVKLEEASNLVELNNILKTNLESKDIIGVSLKQLKKSAKLAYFNFGSNKPKIEFLKYTTGTKGFFGAKDVYLFFTVDGKIQFRTFPDTFQGEIKGKNANHGKLSYGPIQAILKQLKLPQLSEVRSLKKLVASRDEKFMKEFYEYYSRHASDSSKLQYKAFVDTIIAQGDAWMYSKFLGCQLIHILAKQSSYDEFVTACVQYASSSSELSAPFVKLE